MDIQNNIYPEPTSDYEAFKKIQDHFLGKDWYVVDPISHQQVNTIAVAEIIERYPVKKKFRFFKNK